MLNDPTIAFILPIGLTLGGSNTWSLEVARHLAQQGRKAAIIEHTCVSWHPRLSDEVVPEGVQHIVCPGPTPVEAKEKDLAGFADVYRKVLPAIFVPNFSAATYGACALMSHDHADAMRVLGVCHGHASDYTDLLVYYESLLSQILVKNRVMQAELETLLPLRKANIVMKPYAVNVDAIEGRAYSSDDQPVQITYAGRITNHEKRAGNFIPLVRALNDRGVRFELNIVGDGGYKNWLQKEIDDLGEPLKQTVKLHGMMLPRELDRMWAHSDVSILVSDTESGGISILEAMAKGCVPVSTRTHGPSEIIAHGQSGFLVDIDDMEGMADAIALLASDRSKLAKMGGHAFEAARDHFSYSVYMPWFCEMIDHMNQLPPRMWNNGCDLMPPVTSGAWGRARKWLGGIVRRSAT